MVRRYCFIGVFLMFVGICNSAFGQRRSSTRNSGTSRSSSRTNLENNPVNTQDQKDLARYAASIEAFVTAFERGGLGSIVLPDVDDYRKALALAKKMKAAGDTSSEFREQNAYLNGTVKNFFTQRAKTRLDGILANFEAKKIDKNHDFPQKLRHF